jgi:glutaminase
VGDARQSFTIQSISKPFVYGLALEDQGRDAVLGKIAGPREKPAVELSRYAAAC